MIYAASLSAPVKKAYTDMCYSTNVAKIIEQLSLDPQVSGMNACVLGPKDVAGINRQKVQAAVRTKHPDVCVIYVFSKDKEGELLDVPFKKVLKKVDPNSVKDCIDSYIDTHMVSSGQTVVSRDSKATKAITSRPADRKLGSATGAKGKMLRSASSAGEKRSKGTSLEIQHDPALDLHYFLDPVGNMVYCDKETGEPLPPAVVQAQKDRISAEMGYKKPTTRRGVVSLDDDGDDDDDIPIKLPGRDTPNPAEPPSFIAPGAPTPEPAAPAEPFDVSFNNRTTSSLEKNIQSVTNFHDWNLLKETLSKDVAVRELLEENATFQGIVQMLSVLDTEIKATYYDAGLTAQQKFEKILEIGGKRSQLMANHNDMLSRKVIDIMEAVTISARRTVEELLLDHRKAMEQITTADKDIGDESRLLDLINARASAEFELLAVIKGIISLYQAMDIEVNDVILDMDRNLPSDNEFINNMIGSAADILTPTNTKQLAMTMMRALQNKREVMSLLQESVEKVIDAIHNLLQKDQEIIEHQQYMIKMLKAHRVEDAVIIDGVLKNVLHIFVGSNRSGRTATSLTWSGCQSRKRNTLLIDLSRDNKLRDYGVDPIQLDDFLRERIDRQLCVVEGHIMDHENLHEIIREIKTRLDYYAYINVVVDSEDVEYIKVLAEEALTLNYITDCTSQSMLDTKEVYSKVQVNNVARKLILVDPPVDVLHLAHRMDVDVTNTKCVTIPNMSKVKMCAVMHDPPYEYSEVRMAFEEAFR